MSKTIAGDFQKEAQRAAKDLVFCLLSFEGPDPYARAGGLGVRVSNLSETLAARDFTTHLFFVGDPDAPGQEVRMDGRLYLHRWCQWLSAYHRAGVYDGEEGKLQDFTESIPPFLIEEIIRPALASGRLPVILAEDWHTADCIIRLDDQLHTADLRRRCLLFWNANNTMSFHRVNWQRLDAAAQLTTVSRYMKHLMWGLGVNPLVIHNGIPSRLLKPVAESRVTTLRQALAADSDTVMLFKVGRFDPAKRWLMAVKAAALLKAQGYRVVFPLRGGIEPHGQEVLACAREAGLKVTEVDGCPDGWDELLSLLSQAPAANIYNLRFYIPQALLRPFFRATDAVLAKSGHEPFGLVGLEAMAAGGLVFTGATGEEYAQAGRSGVVLGTERPQEIVSQLLELRAQPQRVQTMRRAAREQAAHFTWEHASEMLLEKVRFVARTAGALPNLSDGAQRGPSRKVSDVVIYMIVHQPRRLRLPARPLPDRVTPEALTQALFDDALNERYFHKVSASCYYPAVARFQSLLERGLKLAIGFSLSVLEQAQRWDEQLLERFRELVSHENVEPVAVEPTHSLVLLWDIGRFIERMGYAADRLEQILGVRPVVADTTELMMSDTIYQALDQVGFQGGFIDGRAWVLEWRQPTHLYHHGAGQMSLLARHYQLSDDVGYRFSDRGWDGWPLMADQYAAWLAEHPGDLLVLGWDFETFGEHHREESGIFDFLAALPGEVQRRGLSFMTPSEAIKKYGQSSYDLPLPAFACTWAGSGGLDFFLGNDAQRAVFHLMIQAYNKARLTGNPALLDIALWLAQSDNLHMLQWVSRSGPEAEVSAYFTPGEWWELGPDRIVWEVQQLYKNFIAALNGERVNAQLEEGWPITQEEHL
jgi:alpha-amylase